MMKRWIGISLLFFGAGATLLSQHTPQTRYEIETQKKQNQEQINITQKLLNETRKKEKKSFRELQIINAQINSRQRMLQTQHNELMLVESNVHTVEFNIDSLGQQLDVLKKSYANMIVRGYRTRDRYQNISYLLGAKGFNQALQRLMYLQSLVSARSKQLVEIKETQIQLEDKRDELLGVKKEKQLVIAETKEQKKELESDQHEKTTIISGLKGQEKMLMSKLTQQKKTARQLDNALNAIIAKEIADLKKKKEEEMKKKLGTTSNTGTDVKNPKKEKETKTFLSPDAEKLSTDFQSNMNHLPWPVDKGYILSSFGTHPHPSLKHVNVENNGLDIGTTKGAPVKTVFKGKVVAILTNVPGMQTTVLINHGEYYSVYGHLASTSVKVGDTVTTHQPIGVLAVDDDGESQIHLEIWKGTQKLNPENWLGNH